MPAMKSPAANSSVGAGPREWVLVVDDDAAIRKLVGLCLAGMNLDIVGAANGAEALQLLAAQPDEPVLLLIDVLMPGIDGLTLARRVRPRLKRGSIVFMSGHVTDRSLWPLELRDITFLVKPFRVTVLKDIVELTRSIYRERGERGK